MSHLVRTPPLPNPPPPGGREQTLGPLRSTIETRARVVSLDHGKVWVEASSQQGCAACQSQASCGVSGLGKFFNRNKPPVALACDLAVHPGDSLVLNLAESDLLRAGLLAYLLPALLSVAGAIAATLAGLGDAAAAAAMVAGFAAGLGIARVFARAPHFHISRPTAQPTQGDPHD
jgi:sigma-E factor negative regulatory protein RseC